MHCACYFNGFGLLFKNVNVLISSALFSVSFIPILHDIVTVLHILSHVLSDPLDLLLIFHSAMLLFLNVLQKNLRIVFGRLFSLL